MTYLPNHAGWVNVGDSLRILRVIFPSYPELKPCNPVSALEPMAPESRHHWARLRWTAVGLVVRGQKFRVTGFDIDQHKVDALSKGKSSLGCPCASLLSATGGSSNRTHRINWRDAHRLGLADRATPPNQLAYRVNRESCACEKTRQKRACSADARSRTIQVMAEDIPESGIAG